MSLKHKTRKREGLMLTKMLCLDWTVNSIADVFYEGEMAPVRVLERRFYAFVWQHGGVTALNLGLLRADRKRGQIYSYINCFVTNDKERMWELAHREA